MMVVATRAFIWLALAATSMAKLSSHMGGGSFTYGRARAVPSTCTEPGLFCSDCQMSYLCSGAGATPLELPCDAEQVCGGTSPSAGCRNFVGEAAGDCDCDTVGNSGFLADPYDSSLYFICIPPEGQIQLECAAGQVFSMDDNGCIVEPTTAPPTPADSGSGVQPVTSSIDCTSQNPGFYTNDPTCQSYTVCYLPNLPGLTLECADGEAFDTSSLQCVPECDLAPSTFACSAGDSGAFPDTSDCTIFHVCSNGQQVTPADGIPCGDGQVFESTSMTCVAFSSDVECPEVNSCWAAYCDSCGGECPVSPTTADSVDPTPTEEETPTADGEDPTPTDNGDPTPSVTTVVSSTTTTTTPEPTSTTTPIQTTTEPPTTTPTTTSSTTTTTTTTEPPTTEPPTTTPDSSGPPDCNNSAGYYEESSDCKLFWSCQSDDEGGYEAIQYRCPGNLVYIPSFSYCSFQSDLATAPGCIAS